MSFICFLDNDGFFFEKRKDLKQYSIVNSGIATDSFHQSFINHFNIQNNFFLQSLNGNKTRNSFLPNCITILYHKTANIFSNNKF